MEQWEWNANRGIGVLFECLKNTKVIYRRKTEDIVASNDYTLSENTTIHFLTFSMLNTQDCEEILSTLYINDGTSAGGCQVKEELSLNSCEFQSTPKSILPKATIPQLMPPTPPNKQKEPVLQAIDQMTPEQQQSYAKLAGSLFIELETMKTQHQQNYLQSKPRTRKKKLDELGNHSILNYLKTNTNAKVQVDKAILNQANSISLQKRQDCGEKNKVIIVDCPIHELDNKLYDAIMNKETTTMQTSN